MTTVTITTRREVSVDKTPDPEAIAKIRAKQRAAQMPKPPRTPDGRPPGGDEAA